MDYKTLYEKTKPSRLLVLVAIPGIVSIIVSSLYQIIDGIFVGQHLGSDAFAALNLVMPIVVMNFSVADLIGVGSAVLIAIKIGEKDFKGANNIFTCACLIIVIAGIILGTAIYIFADNFVASLGADKSIIKMASQYIRIYALCSPFTTILFAVDNFLRICGKVRYSMFVNILLALISTVLEFIFLFILGFGIWGASLATCCGMIICTIIAFLPFYTGKTQLKFIKPRFNRKLFYEISANGTPCFLNHIAGRITAVIFNIFLLHFGGAAAVSAYGILMYVDGIIHQIIYGLCDSLQPAIGYNYGSKNFARVKKIEALCFITCGLLSLIFGILIFFGREFVVKLFINPGDKELIILSVRALTIFIFAYTVEWISMTIQAYMSAIGNVKFANIISISATLIFPVTLLFALSFMRLDGLWINMLVSGLLSAVLSITLMLIHLKKK